MLHCTAHICIVLTCVDILHRIIGYMPHERKTAPLDQDCNNNCSVNYVLRCPLLVKVIGYVHILILIKFTSDFLLMPELYQSLF